MAFRKPTDISYIFIHNDIKLDGRTKQSVEGSMHLKIKKNQKKIKLISKFTLNAPQPLFKYRINNIKSIIIPIKLSET